MRKIWVVKAGGELVGLPPVRKKIIKSLRTLMKKHAVVFVHGGGPQIEEELKKSGIPAQFVKGRRATSPEAMTVVERVLSGEINKGFAAELVKNGVKAVGLSCRDGGIVVGKPLPGLGRAAKPVRVNPSLLKDLVAKGYVPVVSSVASDSNGGALNMNADDAASALAISLKAANLVFLTNISGVLDNHKQRIPILKSSRIDSLIDSHVITGGMIPKVQSARAALMKGVGEVDILNGKLGVNQASGTRIIK